ncbi:rod shape-determining protein MreD [Vaginella massiliensis]|uniref:rod shape-determining protein MreD n=1 Tax=Vaginella massiliensis TaxID=1816680 RepID=UPI0008394377|nr:rod shape-determining protein MreD [Vaginella massiliensis]
MFNRDFFIQVLKIIFLILLQTFIFDHIEIMDKAKPFVYILFVIFYPIYNNRFAFLLLSFVLGLGIDFMEQTGGIHTFATVAVAFFRHRILKVITGQSFEEQDRYNSYEISTMQWFWLALFITLVHHLILFVLENFKLAHLLEVVVSALYSTVLTLIFIIFYKILFKRKQRI